MALFVYQDGIHRRQAASVLSGPYYLVGGCDGHVDGVGHK